jgi:hypothetical protein
MLCKHIKNGEAKLVYGDGRNAAICPICKRIIATRDIPKKFREKSF